MNNALLIAVLAGFGGMFGWGLADFFAKKTIDNVGPIKSLVWAHVFGTTTLLAILLGQAVIKTDAVNFPTTVGAWLGLLGFGVLQMLVYWLVYLGFEKGQVAILSPVFASYSGIVAVVAIVAFGEHANGWFLLAVAVLFIGILLVNTDPAGIKGSRFALAPGVKEVAAAAALASIWTLGWDKFVAGQDPVTYAFCMYAFMTLAAICLARFLLKEAVRGIPKGIWKYLALSGIGEAVAYVSVTKGYSATSLTGVVALLSGAFTLPTIVLAYIFFKERISRLQTAAIGLIVIGIIIISLNG